VNTIEEKFGEIVWLPSTVEMEKMNISFHVVVQNPGDIVYVSYGSIHWVIALVRVLLFIINFFKQNGGVNVAWNHLWLLDDLIELMNQKANDMLTVPLLAFVTAQGIVQKVSIPGNQPSLELVDTTLKHLGAYFDELQEAYVSSFYCLFNR